MAKSGYLTIRNVPEPKKNTPGTYFKLLTAFFKVHRLCPKCKGKGHLGNGSSKTLDMTVIRFQGIESLEKLNAVDGITMADVIKEVLEAQISGRKPCKCCHGFRFITRERHVEITGSSKKKTIR